MEFCNVYKFVQTLNVLTYDLFAYYHFIYKRVGETFLRILCTFNLCIFWEVISISEKKCSTATLLKVVMCTYCWYDQQSFISLHLVSTMIRLTLCLLWCCEINWLLCALLLHLFSDIFEMNPICSHTNSHSSKFIWNFLNTPLGKICHTEHKFNVIQIQKQTVNYLSYPRR